ncbi:hypothetical protein AOXY_G286 [Acipenser oxyrinchus oxyrinchus]|uniref:HECT domain-containing protein n=1 Tax=Acipenser oxyrinchus oxyrinchus TaxID=40147 RepID=A0AAD8GJT0_ACIOX|nr:hypothetical protein AOXY_G286 [Acipenser oxyrinchus oxyrinchus]
MQPRNTFTHKFCCLSGKDDSVIPTRKGKDNLLLAGLGEKKITFQNKDCSPEEFTAELMENFPKLRDGGSYELIRAVGSTRCTSLSVILCPDEGYSPSFLRSPEYGVGSATIYVRPLEQNLNMDVIAENLLSLNGPKVTCVHRHEDFAHSEVRRHVDLCSDGSSKTLIFVGQEDHLVPTTSRFPVESAIFQAVGHMIGHCFLHGGPPLTGLSPAVVCILTGGEEECAPLQIQDCPDVDLDNQKELTQEDNDKMSDIILNWDLPPVTEENRRWLAEKILLHAVIGRRTVQIRQLKGLRDTGVLQMIKERPNLSTVLFPPSSAQIFLPQTILERIVWPSSSTSDSEDEIECSIDSKCRVASFFRQFIENASSAELSDLVKFWIGWAILPQHLNVEVTSDMKMPTAATCMETIKLPGQYTEYSHFH